MKHVLRIKAPITTRPGDGIGRHARLKIWCPYGCGGSSPPLGTIKNSLTIEWDFFVIELQMFVYPTQPIQRPSNHYDFILSHIFFHSTKKLGRIQTLLYRGSR